MRTYTITKENRVANSPFSIAGSNVEFDITAEYPLPLETTTFDAQGNPIDIRLILGCNTINKQEQIKMGYPAVRRPTETERKLLTFMGGMMSIPDDYKIASEYLETAGWYADKKGPRPINTRIIYEMYDQEALDNEILESENMITEARQMVNNAKREQLAGILRLAQPGAQLDVNLPINQMKLRCLDIANNNPDFILKAIKVARNDITVLVSKSVDYGILNLDTTGVVKMQRKDDPKKFSVIAKVTDVGGRHQKIERTVSFLQSEDGKAALTDLKKMAKDYELMHFEVEEEEEESEEFTSRNKGLNKNQQQIPLARQTTPPPIENTNSDPLENQTTEAIESQ